MAQSVLPGPRAVKPTGTASGWRLAFMQRPPIKAVPRDTGSRRRLSLRRLREHAATIVVQAIQGRRAQLPVAWLAVLLYDLDVNRPPGARRADARRNAGELAGILAVSADWRSGRRARPGRQVSAALTGRCERTVTRHLALMEDRGFCERTVDGRMLDAEQRAAAAADVDVTQHQRNRWVDRSEWRLQFPAWVRELAEEKLQPYVEQAAAILDRLAAPARGQRGCGSVTPSLRTKVLGRLPLVRGTVSSPADSASGRVRSSCGTVAKGQKGASRSSTRAEPEGRPRRWAPGAAALARQLVRDARLAFIGGMEHVPRVAGVLTKLGLSKWTADDVVLEARLRLREAGGKPMMGREQVRSVAGYLEFLMRNAVPDEPPAQIAAATAPDLSMEDALDELRQAAWADLVARDAAEKLARDLANPSGGRAAARAIVAAAARTAVHKQPARLRGSERSDPRFLRRK